MQFLRRYIVVGISGGWEGEMIATVGSYPRVALSVAGLVAKAMRR